MEALKNFISENKKLFYTLLGIVGTFIFLFIIIALTRGCSKQEGTTYSSLEQKMVEEAEKYIVKNNKQPKEEGGEVTVTLNELIQNKQIKSFNKIEDGTCNGSVTMKKNGNDYMLYPNLDCKDEYHTQVLSNILVNNVVTKDDGLYKVGDMYIFKGEYVNNYVSFGGYIWRITSLDKDKNIRMVIYGSEKEDDDFEIPEHIWDDRYNATAIDEDDEIVENAGINNYTKSRIKEHLNETYLNSKFLNSESRKHLIPYNVCIGKRNESDNSISLKVDCSESIKNQYIGLPYYAEYAMASLDGNCKTVFDKSCSNYNYLGFISGSWTTIVNNKNTYQAFTVSGVATNCLEENRVYYIVNLSKNEVVCNGNGSKANPYIIKESNLCRQGGVNSTEEN